MASGSGSIRRRWNLSSWWAISILSPQLIDDPPTAPLGTPSLGNMLSLAAQGSIAALIARELAITAVTVNQAPGRVDLRRLRQ
ncbi:hypothetical protein N431DRAFT_472463 [Stipitochalara longipes BDJ]|nr:hypothetical protein N431DRAFT_472463 [Stipitochalara longipes BDJ]